MMMTTMATTTITTRIKIITYIFYHLSSKHGTWSHAKMINLHFLNQLNLILSIIAYFPYKRVFTIHAILDLRYSDRVITDDHISEGHCYLYAVIREKAVGVTLNICSAKERTRQLYTTSTSTIEISIITENIEEDHPGFLFEFQGTVLFPNKALIQALHFALIFLWCVFMNAYSWSKLFNIYTYKYVNVGLYCFHFIYTSLVDILYVLAVGVLNWYE